jgi:NAD-dependent deacetylase
MQQTEKAIALVLPWVQQASRIVVLTGAGVSAESGVPTFRGDKGLWRSHNPMQLATPDAFDHDPRVVWAWYRWRQNLVRRCQPNAGHKALVTLQQRLGSGFTLVTQNVDALHARAGSTSVNELHGNLFADRCTRCGAVEDAFGRAPDDAIHPDNPEFDPPLPYCRACGGLLRPGVVWFGEQLPDDAMESAARAARKADLLLVVGTSGVVYPAAGLADDARRAGARVVVINTEATSHSSSASCTILGHSAQILPALVNPEAQ